MKGRLVLLNLVLIALAAGAAWQLRVQWADGRAREKKALQQAAPGIQPLPPAAVHAPQPAVASAYAEVAQKMLFSEDRNPDVTLEVAPPKPVPSFPAAYGVMGFGSAPIVFLSDKQGAPSRGYSAGDKVGEFTLVSVEPDEIVLEFDGRKFSKTIHELKPRSAEPAAAVASAPVAPAPAVQQVAPAQMGPGAQTSVETKACVPGDTSPAGTVRDGYRKIVLPTPFGASCRWEIVK